MNRKTLFAALACALLVFSMLGCGTTNDLRTITLNVALVNGVAPTDQSGFVTLVGNGGTIQLQALGNYSGSKPKDLTRTVTYTVIVDPEHNMDAFGNTLLPPCQAPACPVPSTPPYTNGTIEYNNTGLLTAIEPATCTFEDIAPLSSSGAPVAPAWFYVGDYVVTASYGGITSQPVYVPIASSAGNQFYNGQENNPDGYCGSGTY